MDYKKDARINEQALEQEWLDQPDLAISYGREWAAAKKLVADLDEQVKIERSKLINKAWEDPQKCLKQPKATAQTVEAYYRTNKKHIKAKEKLSAAQLDLDLIEVAYKEMSFTRKMALENLVKLYASDYFAGPNVPRDIVKERKIREDAKSLSTPLKRDKKKKDKSKKKKKK